MSERINVFTHNGLFHADDVFAAAIISSLSDDINFVRGGDEDIPEDTAGWIIFDIGGGELDHHTPECKEANGNHPGTNIPYAACGLVWRKYYEDVLRAENCPEQYYRAVYERIEKSLILGIDAADNGVNTVAEAMNEMPNITDAQKKRLISEANTSFTVSQLIKDFNPSWESDRDPYEAFLDAVSFARDIFLNRLDSVIDALDGRDYVLQHIDYSANHLMILEKFAPWQGVVTGQSYSNAKAKDLWYVVSPALRGGWNVQCVLDNPDERTSYRHPLPESWYGLRDEQLQEVCGVKNARFVHPSGFLAGADDEAGALAMVDAAMKSDK